MKERGAMSRKNISTKLAASAAIMAMAIGTTAAQAQAQAAAPEPAAAAPAPAPDPKTVALKKKVVEGVEARAKLGQVMTDSIYSFGELGFQETETSNYVTAILEKNGFTIQREVAGMPTGWTATWGKDGPLIALGSDIDGIPKASQKPGIPFHDPIIAGAPGHGEGHNSGQPLIVVAALAAKELMEKEKIPGRLMIWPGVAEEQLAGKAFFVRDGVFKNVDAVIFVHVASAFGTSWGQAPGTGMVSVQYDFHGASAHSAGAPWMGRSALDGVELMNIAWNMRREHLQPQQRSHYVINNGGDQPNVVPSEASVWYYFREQTFDAIKKNFELGNKISEAAAMATDTTVTRKMLGSAAPRHFNKPMAEALSANIEAVGMPVWSEDDQAFAKTVQFNLGAEEKGLPTELMKLRAPVEKPDSGGSDDIGDVSWVVPTVALYYPSNIPGLPGHHWSNGIAMATPIAHKGVVVGAKAVAMTLVDLLTNPTLLTQAKTYFTDDQLKKEQYIPMISATDKAPTYLNAGIMGEYKGALKPYYYDPAKYPTYLQQLGISYPNLTRVKK